MSPAPAEAAPPLPSAAARIRSARLTEWPDGRAPWMPGAFLAALFAAFALLVPGYLSPANLNLLASDFAEPALLALAMTVVVAAGGIDLSLGAVFALSNLAALLLFRVAGLPLPVAAGAVLALALALGGFNGALVAGLRARPFLTTLATLLALRSVYDLAAQAFAVPLATAGHDSPAWRFLGGGSVLGLPANFALMLAAALLLHGLLAHTRFGTHLRATGSDASAAHHAGVRVRRVRFLAHVLASGLAGLAGLLYAARQDAAGSNLGQGWEILALTAVVLGGVSLSGGRGGVVHGLVGAGLVFVLSSGLLRLNVPGGASSAVVGAVLLLAVAATQRFGSRGARVATVPDGARSRSGPLASSAPAFPAPIPPARSVRAEAGGPVARIVAGRKAYGGVQALDGVEIAFRAGEVHALLGQNGAGKSTLVRILTGAARLSAGRIEVDGRARRFGAPADALAAGLVMVQQEGGLVPHMTVAENLRLGREPPFGHAGALAEARAALAEWGRAIDPGMPAARLGTALRQIVEIVRATRRGARLILFDEPTASLTPAERARFFALVERLRADGVAVVLITHALEEALNVADRVTVLRDGRVVASGPAANLSRAELVARMVGTVPTPPAPPTRSRRGARVLSVENLGLGVRSPGMSFAVHAGEVVALAGLLGAGRTEVAKRIAGLVPRSAWGTGTIRLDGRPVDHTDPARAVAAGIVYVTEDREAEGLFAHLPAEDNVVLGALAARPRRSGVFYPGRGARRRLAEAWFAQLGVAPLRARTPSGTFSGGNQQRIVLARALAQAPRVVLLDEPTRGVDVGAVPQIHAAVRALAAEGKAVLVISSSIEEVLAVADRVLVAREGRIVADLDPRTATKADVASAALG